MAHPTQGWRRWFGRSLKRRLVLLFLLMATALAGVFIAGAQRVFTTGWREAAKPLVNDYLDHLTQSMMGNADGRGPPDVARAQALTQRLPITVTIEGPVVRWASHPDARRRPWRAGAGVRVDEDASDWARMLSRTTADGHRIDYGIDEAVFDRSQRRFGWTLGALLLITLAAYLVVRHWLKPLDAIRTGAQRFGRGQFDAPIPMRQRQRPDELEQLAGTVNTMAQGIQQMLEAKRALLLAISHELRSPLTRARLHVELLPEQADTAAPREALLRDLQEMASLVNDLLESERLASRHATLQREPVDVLALVEDVRAELQARHAGASAITVSTVSNAWPSHSLDRARMRLLLRNVLDNALRHGGDALQPPHVTLQHTQNAELVIEVRDHGPGVPESQLPHLADAFYRPDSARTRSAGGVGLGLYLCRLVAQAHGGQLTLHAAMPGLLVRVVLPV